ncbi:maltoporin LamB [Vibrio marisflavi]|uniref:Maltoporin n=1 Tax=Vibrio marisflavi CECT 7928 TaxID=634439 RepID=A0ABN8DZ64_9VIBR|nr:maltoporin LamB [Vibrio marisflavi]CAH0537037.1 Maltoporin [Vibrio marisflavi CECT 7928]
MKKLSLLAAAVATTLAAGSAFAVDFTGYFRAGTGVSGSGNSDIAYDKNGVGRLGNESDNYYEFGFNQALEKNDQKWELISMIAAGDDGNNADDETNWTKVSQFAIKTKGLIGSDPEAEVWAGKMYYQRHDIHITDFYFLNTSGTGGGIQNLSVGDQKLSVALVQDADTDNSSSSYIFDTRVADINLWEDGSLELGIAYNFATNKSGYSEAADDGVFATAIFNQNIESGFNQTVLQFGNNGYGQQAADWGAGKGYTRGTSAYNGSTGYRVLNWGVVSLSKKWEFGHQLAYLAGSDIGGLNSSNTYTGQDFDIHQYSAVVRPMYQWTNNMRTIVEAGYNAGKEINTAGTATQDFGLAKFTLAQAWALGEGFWARPEIRVYGSYLADTENNNTFGTNDNSEYVFGIQAEAWW